MTEQNNPTEYVVYEGFDNSLHIEKRTDSTDIRECVFVGPADACIDYMERYSLTNGRI